MLRVPAAPAYVSTQTAITATGVSANIILPNQDFNSFIAGLFVSAASGTTPTLDLYLQVLASDGNWYDMYHWAQKTAASTANTQDFAGLNVARAAAIGIVGSKTIAASTLGVGILGNTFRLAWTVGGTTPSFSFAVNLYQNDTASRGA